MLSVVGDVLVFTKGLDCPGLTCVAEKLTRRKLNTQELKCPDDGGGCIPCVAPALAEGTTSIGLTSEAERATTTKPEALEPQADDNVRRGRERVQPKASPTRVATASGRVRNLGESRHFRGLERVQEPIMKGPERGRSGSLEGHRS